MTMLIICVIVMINTFIVNTINGMKHYSCISLLLCTPRQWSQIISLWNHHKNSQHNFWGGGGRRAQPLPILPPWGGAHPTPFDTSILTPLAFGPCDELRYHA